MPNWITPKTDWKQSDYRNYTDHERIQNNFEVLQESLAELFSITIALHPNAINSYESFPTFGRINQLEENLEKVGDVWPLEPAPESKEWNMGSENERPTFEDFNRWEELQLRFYQSVRGTTGYFMHCNVGKPMQQSHTYHARNKLVQNYFRKYYFGLPILIFAGSGAACGQAFFWQNRFRRSY